MKNLLKIIIVIPLLSLSISFAYSAEELKINTVLPQNSVAVTSDALSSFFNPAGLSFVRGLDGYYLRTYYGDSKKDDAIFIAAGAHAFSTEFANTTDGIIFRRYTLADGFRLTDRLHFGMGYSWYTSDDENYDALAMWQMGAIYRRQHLSIGAVARNLNYPRYILWGNKSPLKIGTEKLKRAYDVGIALRPLNSNLITLSVDARHYEDDKVWHEGWDVNYMLEIVPVQGILMRGSVNDDKSFNVCVGVNFTRIGFGTYNTFNAEKEHQDGVGYVHLSKGMQSPRYIRRRVLVEADINEIKSTLRRAKDDKEVKGAILKLRGTDYGIGRLQEIRDTILDFKATGKKTICYMESCSTGNYLLASACDKIILHPSGEVRLTGIRAEVTFFKGILDKLGVRADIEHIGEYKSASELLTREEMSKAHRESLNSILDDLFDQITQAIAQGRNWSVEEVKRKIDQAPYTAKESLNANLADVLAYKDEIYYIAEGVVGKRCSVVKAKSYQSQLANNEWYNPPHKIAVIYAEGTIVTGNSFSEPFTGTNIMGSDTISEAIEIAGEDNSIKAIVLRIDSGGGLVLASDIIWRQLMLTKGKKPIIVSMGDTAASGGYYIAAPADVIIAEPGTITGSIGVISGKYSLKGLYNKLGIKKEIEKRGKHADFYSNYGDYPEEERQIVKRQIKQIYDDFVSKVADGRNMSHAEVNEIGRGRVWTGNQAKKNGLVDKLGGFDLAMEIAKERAGLKATDEIRIVPFPKPSLFSKYFGYIQTPSPLSDLQTEIKLFSNLAKHRIFLLMPYSIQVGN